MDEDYLYRELKARRIRSILTGLVVLAVILAVGYFLIERMLASIGLQPAPEGFEDTAAVSEGSPQYGYVASWTGEGSETIESLLPDYEITVEDYRIAGLSRVGRPSAVQEQLSRDLFIVINDDPGEKVLSTMESAGIDTDGACTFSVLVRDNPGNWQTLSVFDPVTVTFSVPDALEEAAFTENITAYAVYNRQYPDSPGGLAALPVSVSEENGYCYVSILVREEYETEYALVRSR